MNTGRGSDTLDKGPSKLLLQQADLDNYFKHRRRLTDMNHMTEFGDGSHIVHINQGGADKILTDRNKEIEK